MKVNVGMKRKSTMNMEQQKRTCKSKRKVKMTSNECGYEHMKTKCPHEREYKSEDEGECEQESDNESES